MTFSFATATFDVNQFSQLDGNGANIGAVLPANFECGSINGLLPATTDAATHCEGSCLINSDPGNQDNQGYGFMIEAGTAAITGNQLVGNFSGFHNTTENGSPVSGQFTATFSATRN